MFELLMRNLRPFEARSILSALVDNYGSELPNASFADQCFLLIFHPECGELARTLIQHLIDIDGDAEFLVARDPYDSAEAVLEEAEFIEE